MANADDQSKPMLVPVPRGEPQGVHAVLFRRLMREALQRDVPDLEAWVEEGPHRYPIEHELAGGQLPAVRFDFAFQSPAYASNYGKVFPAPLQFGCAQSAFWFDAAQLKQPVRRDERAMRAFLADARAQVIVPRRGDELCSARVRAHLQHTQPAWPDLAATAEALHMSTSTLQRRLASEGTSFQSLKDELRRDTAIVRLISGTVPLATLAFELGFADSAAFQRAFKVWTGSAPGAYRRGGP